MLPKWDSGLDVSVPTIDVAERPYECSAIEVEIAYRRVDVFGKIIWTRRNEKPRMGARFRRSSGFLRTLLEVVGRVKWCQERTRTMRIKH
jgi:hypothetical protein